MLTVKQQKVEHIRPNISQKPQMADCCTFIIRLTAIPSCFSERWTRFKRGCCAARDDLLTRSLWEQRLRNLWATVRTTVLHDENNVGPLLLADLESINSNKHICFDEHEDTQRGTWCQNTCITLGLRPSTVRLSVCVRRSACVCRSHVTNVSPRSNRVLRLSDDLSLGKVHWDLALCLMCAWVICYFCIWKGIKSTGKVVYFTATFPYLMLFILFVRGVTLPGAAEGLKYYLTPDFSKIAEPDVWRDAGTQVFFSYAVCQGVLTALASYNKYNNNCYRDCMALCCLNSATSIFAGFAVFSVLGFMANDLGITMEEVAASGPGLAFIAYPKALSLLPGSSFWAVLFFLMILFLGLDSQFVCVESLCTAITDLFPRQLRRPGAREILVLVIAVVCFLLGLPLISEGGIVLFQLVDTYGPSGTSLLIIACCETIVIAWFYGADRFYDNIKDMIGYPPLLLLKYCWLFITPLICTITMLYDLTQARPLVVQGHELGTWGTTLGTLLTLTPLLCIPAFILLALFRNPKNMRTPSSDLRQAQPHNPVLTLCNRVIFKAQGPQIKDVDESNEKMMTNEPGGV